MPKARHFINPAQAQRSVGANKRPMKRIPILLALCLIMANLNAQTETELNAWNDVKIHEINRLYPRTNVVPVGEEFSKLLNGDWKFQWVDSSSKAPADFYKEGYNASG